MPPLPPIIRHIHLPSITPFHIVQSLQTHLVSQFLSHKKLASSPSKSNHPSPSPAPTPIILTFVPTPVYTTGRREHDAISAEQLAILKAPLSPLRKTSHNKYRNPEWADVVPTLRGGQTTFHGPGQLVVYPILDLKPSPSHTPSQHNGGENENAREEGGEEGIVKESGIGNTPLYTQHPKGISVRCYVHLLEQCTINTLAHWTLKGIRTSNPGVWEESGERKIAALGVHLRRNITSYGVGLNVNTDLRWFDRIVACGLVGKGVVSMRDLGEEVGAWEYSRYWLTAEEREERGIERERERGPDGRRPWLETIVGKNGQQLRARLKPGIVAKTWAREFARGLVGEGGEERVIKVGIEELDVPESLLAAYKLETEPWRNDWEDDW